MKRASVCIIALLLCACDLGIFDGPNAPTGEYVTVEIIGGSLRVSQGSCGSVDLSIIEDRANRGVIEMRGTWSDTYPASEIAVSDMPVWMTAGLGVSGIYYNDHRWIALACDNETTIHHELRHAIAHRLRLPCQGTIGHTSNVDCSPSGRADAW